MNAGSVGMPYGEHGEVRFEQVAPSPDPRPLPASAGVCPGSTPVPPGHLWRRGWDPDEEQAAPTGPHWTSLAPVLRSGRARRTRHDLHVRAPAPGTRHGGPVAVAPIIGHDVVGHAHPAAQGHRAATIRAGRFRGRAGRGLDQSTVICQCLFHPTILLGPQPFPAVARGRSWGLIDNRILLKGKTVISLADTCFPLLRPEHSIQRANPGCMVRNVSICGIGGGSQSAGMMPRARAVALASRRLLTPSLR